MCVYGDQTLGSVNNFNFRKALDFIDDSFKREEDVFTIGQEIFEDQVNVELKYHEISFCSLSEKDILMNLKKRKYNEKKNLVCTHCNYRTSANSILKRHIDSVHLGIRKYKCSQCEYQATREIHLKDHINNVHLKIKNTNVVSVNIKQLKRSS
ncbi:hypothetical protein HHI36_017059 [Cryptolaemus montrouzieri]|uniref:C2H2-type domain-containing protein n=1 Tax=Cryptolaemus montrouzieri TaxID=559131 RepID=A0ABD2NM82_9CUCU